MAQHCIRLTEEEEKDFIQIKKETGFGATAMLRAMIKSLKKTEIED